MSSRPDSVTAPEERRRLADQLLAGALRQWQGGDDVGCTAFRAMVEHSGRSMALLAADGTILEANAHALALLGTTRELAIGELVWNAPTWAEPGLRQQLQSSVTAAARGVTVGHQLALAGVTDPTTIEISFTPVADRAGDVVLIVTEWRDITDRARAEAALRESEERLNRIISIAADAIISMDDAQRITLFNEGAEKIFGYKASEVVGQPLAMLLPRDVVLLHAKEVSTFAGTPEAARRMGERRNIHGRRKNGEIFSAEASISKATIGGTRVFTAVLRDVTERIAAEQEKTALLQATQKARDDAERATRQRDEMLAIVSHDLRNPLSGIGLCAGLLANGDTPPDERQRLADTIQESLEWTQRLISDLMDIASIEAGRLSINRKRHDPMMTIGRALSMFDLRIAELSIELHVEGAEHLPALEADAERLLQVMANLIGNALKFTPAGGAITIGAEAVDQTVVFSVRDTGSGISPDRLPHVFDRRWQADHPTVHGTGLGLAIAHGIVDAHGGRIWVASSTERGTEFKFSIPLPEPR